MGRGGATGMARAKWTVVARILRVNHGGEYGAIRIYRSQIAIARWRCPELLPFLTETLAHEQTHIAQFRGLMPARASKPCRMMWLWGVGGLILGGVTALLGRQGVLICTEAVERTVHRHWTTSCGTSVMEIPSWRRRSGASSRRSWVTWRMRLSIVAG